MSEKELMDLDFEKVMVYDEESDNGYDYYYFRKQLLNDIWLIGDVDLKGHLNITLGENTSGPKVRNINVIKELIDVFSKIKNAGREASVSKENG